MVAPALDGAVPAPRARAWPRPRRGRSRRASVSNGLLVPDVDSAVMLAKPASAVIVSADSAPPLTHDVATVPGDLAGAVAERVGRCRTRRADGLARTLEAVAHRDRGAAGVGHHHRHEEGRHPPFALLHAHFDLALERVQPADAGADDDADAAGVGAGVTGLRRAPRPRPPWRTAGPGRRGGPPWGCRTTGSGPSRRGASRSRRWCPGPRSPCQKASLPTPHGASTP